MPLSPVFGSPARPRSFQFAKICQVFLVLFLITILLLVGGVLGVVTVFRVLVLLFSFFLLFRHFHLFDWSIWVNTQLLGHESVDSVDKGGWVGNFVAGLNESSLEENLRGVQGGGILLVCLHLGQKVHDDRMVGVHLQCLPSRHHANLILVLEGLCLHNLLLLGRVAELRGDDNNRGVSQSLGQLHLLDLDARILHGALLSKISELLLPPVGQRLVHVL